MKSSTLTIKGQITIPKRLRDYLGLSPGDKVRFEYTEDGAVRIMPPREPARGKGRKPSRFAALRGTCETGMSTDEIMNLLRGYGDDADDPGFKVANDNFLDDAARADVAMQKSGVGYAMPDVHAYVAAKVRGKQVKRPNLVKWRK